MSNTRAKFHCNSVTKRKGWSGTPEFLYEAEFSVVTSGSEENKNFFASTPSGNIKIGTVRENQFEVGKDYFIDFSPAEEAA